MTTATEGNRRAIVIGASIAGCLMARSLARHFREVLLLDIDHFSPQPAPRKTVPQEHHVHLLLNRGLQAIESFYPSFRSRLRAAGAEEIDLSHGVKCYAGVGWKQRWPTGITAHYCSRTLLEHELRRLASELENVTIQPGVRVRQLIHEQGQVCGVITDEAEAERRAELVIDASGRGSRASAWLKQLGYGEVVREEVENQLGYVSRVYQRNPAERRSWKVLLVTPDLPRKRSMGVISPVEGDRFIVTAGGWFGDCPKPNEEDFMRFLAGLAVPDLHQAVSQLVPVGGFHQFKMPCSLRRRYDQMPAFPAGLLIAGDALCSINPIYSQGMSVSALQAEALDARLSGYLQKMITAQQVMGAMITATAVSWDQAKKSDLSLSRETPPVSWREGLKNRYSALVSAAAFHNRQVATATLRVTNLLDEPHALYRLPVIRASLYSALERVIR